MIAHDTYRADGTESVGPIVTTDGRAGMGLYGMHRADLLNALAARLPVEAVRLGHGMRGNCPDRLLARLHFAHG